MKHRQRGLGWIGLLVYVAIAGAIAAAVYGAYRAVVSIGRTEMRVEWKDLIEKCEGMQGDAASCRRDWDTAIAQRQQALDANKQLAGDVTNLRTEVDACNAGTQALADAKKQADADKARSLAVAKTALDALASDKRASLTRSAAPPAGTTAEQCARIMLGLQEVAVREFRDRPPENVAPAAQEGSGSTQTAPGKGRAPDPRKDRLEVR